MTAPRTEPQRETALRLLGENGIMRPSELKAAGIHYQTLARMVADGAVMRVGRGIYELPEADYSWGHNFAEVTTVIPKGVICLISALVFYDLTLQMPPHIWVAVGRKDRKPCLKYPPVRAVRFGEKAMSMGIEYHTIDKVEVPIFNAAKTIVDCFRYRHTVGMDVALEGLRNGIRRRKAHPDQVVDYARELNVWSVVQPYIDATLADEG